MKQVIACLVLAAGLQTGAVMGESTVTYQGQLVHSGQPFDGQADLGFALFDSAEGGQQIGATLMLPGHPVSDGLFQADLDFGPGAFDGQPRWLQVEVDGQALLPRQAVRATPLALVALSLAEGGGDDSPWVVDGAHIHYTVGNVGIGLDDPQAPLHVAGSGLFGSIVNSIDGSNHFVAGGTDFSPHTVSGSGNAIVGGQGNVANGSFGLVGGEGNTASAMRNFATGLNNVASGDSSFAAGGASNTASGFQSFVAGNSSVSGGNFTTAMGRQAHALHHGSFVWSDSFTTPFSSTANNQFMINAHGGFAVVGEFDTGEIPLEGSGTRMMWYPGKSAFRAGRISGVQWNDANIGDDSVAMGRDVRASGTSSTAFGRTTRAEGTFSTATGFSTIASGDRSVAMGTNSTAQSFASVVIGRYNLVGGSSVNWQAGDPLFVAGNGTGVDSRSNALTLYKNGNLEIAGVLTENSDRDSKHDIRPIDPMQVLQGIEHLPVSTWRYNHSPEAMHIGPMAQDFHQRFGFGAGEHGIAGIDIGGVALAGIQGLLLHVRDQQREIDALRETVAHQQQALAEQQRLLADRLARLEALLSADRESGWARTLPAGAGR